MPETSTKPEQSEQAEQAKQVKKPEPQRPAAELGFDQSDVPAEQANQTPDAEPTAETAAGKDE